MRIYIIYNILWVTTQTQLVLTPPPKLFSCQGSDLSSLGILILKKQGLMMVSPFFWQIFLRGCSAMIFEGLLNAPSTAHGARSAAATKLRRSRCCDGAAQTSSVALILRVTSRRDTLNEEPASFPRG